MKKILDMLWQTALVTNMAFLLLTGCSSESATGDDVGPCKGGTVCEADDDCNRGEYCASSGCCLDGCAFDQDCADGETCDTDEHVCVTSKDDGGADDAGSDGGGSDDGGSDDDGGVGDDGGAGDADEAAGDGQCPETHDKTMGQECECDGQCVAEAPFCFADVMNDPGPTYCTIPDCTPGSCPDGYLCNDFYTQADPPQPAFCQKCLGGEHAMGEDCLCDSDCSADAPDCFKDLVTQGDASPSCTITDCTVGEGDECPGTWECTISVDMQSGTSINYCKPCDPGDHSLQEGQECGCNKDCVDGAVCHKDPFSQDPATCVMCLGGAPRGFGEDCQCDEDCSVDFPTCLPSGRYCSVLGCTENPDLCPEGVECKDVFGLFSFCKKP